MTLHSNDPKTVRQIDKDATRHEQDSQSLPIVVEGKSLKSLLEIFDQHKSTFKKEEDFFKLFFNHDALKKFQEKINYKFKDERLLVKAITHSSLCHESRHLKMQSNEKLEFLGDSVLGLVVSQNLYEKFDKLSEGDLSKLRSALVNEDILTEMAIAIGLNEIILRGKGERAVEDHRTSALMCDCFEAVMAAIYLDSDFVTVANVFEDMKTVFEAKTKQIYYDDKRLMSFDAKTTLQEEVVKLYKEFPLFEADEISPGQFKVRIVIKGTIVGELIYPSKKKGLKLLAKKVLEEKKYILN